MARLRMVETDIARSPELQTELSTLEARRRRDRLIGLGLVLSTFAATFALSLWAKRASRPELSGPPMPATTEGLEGFPQGVDPVRSFAAAREVTRRKLLRGLAIEGVRSDGKIDLSEGPGRARYVFQSLPGEGPQPPRPTGELARRPYCGKQTVHLRREGLVADPDQADYPCAPALVDDLPEPRCGAAEVWRHAIEKGAPADRLARVEYYRARVGPAWRFELPGTPHRFSLYGDCGRELEASEATGFVP
jgi:hypothetical protein